MRLRAELHSPLYVPAGFGIKGIGQILLLRHHVARPSLSPLRLVRGGSAEDSSPNNEAATNQPAPNSKLPAAGEVEQNPQDANPTAFHGGTSAGNVRLP